MALVVVDEHLGVLHPMGEIRFPTARVTIAGLIAARVELEVERERRRRAATAVDPAVRNAAEDELNMGKVAQGGWILAKRHPDGEPPSSEDLIEEAQRAFAAGRFFILLGNRQAESLDEMVELAETTEATFMRLTPLQGG
jgi:hypothetical protein